MICIDNRVPILTSDKQWRHNIDCSYNPYIMKWKGEEGYVPIEECGIYKDDEIFFVNSQKVDKLNQELWGE